MKKRKHKGRSKEIFSMNTVTLDGSCVKDNVQWKDVQPRDTHYSSMCTIQRNKAKFFH